MSKEVKKNVTMMVIATLVGCAGTAHAAVSVGRVSVPARVSTPAPARVAPPPAPKPSPAPVRQANRTETAPLPVTTTNPALFMGGSRKSDCDPVKDKDCRK